MLKKLLNRTKNKNTKKDFNQEVYDSYLNNDSLKSSLSRLKRLGVEVSTVIDVGASNGCWSAVAQTYYSKAKYLLLEAQSEHEKQLQEFSQKNDNVNYVIAAASNSDGTIEFDCTDLWGGLAITNEKDSNSLCKQVKSTRIDTCVKNLNLNGPYLIKLDTHGHELKILEGAGELLRDCNLIIIETYNYKINNEALKFHETCYEMEKLGFHCVDISDITYRKKDDTLWQMDLYFVPNRLGFSKYNEFE
ncbi:MAG: FkbM family methyltransferase [bacterium]